MRELLDYQADQIERVLASHGVPGRVYGGSVSPRLVEFHVAPAAGVRIARIEGLAEELAMYLGVRSCRVQRRGAVVSVEVPKDHPPTVRLLSVLAGLKQNVPPVTAVLGQDNEGVPTLLRLPSPDVAHVLISGTTGSGKTELARTMILSLVLCNTPERVRLILLDPKGRGYRAFAGLPHLVCPVISDVGEAHNRLAGLADEMERRDRAGLSDPQIVVFVDEMADLMMVGGKQMIQTMTRLTQRGREAGIHIVACTQKPTAAVVGGLVKSNFPARLAGSVSSADDARIATGIAGSGAEKLAGHGDFLLVVKGEVRRIQAALSPADEIAAAVERLCGRPAPALAAADRSCVACASACPEQTQPPQGHDQPVVTTGVHVASQAPIAAHSQTLDQEQPDPDGNAALPETDPFQWRPINSHLRIGHHRPA